MVAYGYDAGSPAGLTDPAQPPGTFRMKLGFLLIVLFCCLAPAAHATERALPDRVLRDRLAGAAISPLDRGPEPPSAKARLGQLLFFDKVLGGNRDTACATCHHPALTTGDALSLSIGTGGIGLGPTRVKGVDRPFVARNATDLFDRGSPEWTTMFWDFRVSPRGCVAEPRRL